MKRLLACLLCLTLLFGAALPAFAAEAPPSVKVYWDGLLRLRGYRLGDELYLAPLDICLLFGLEAEERLDADGYCLSLPLWTCRLPRGGEIAEADGRYLYCPQGLLSVGSKQYLPASALERLFGLHFTLDGDRAVLDASGFQLLRGGEDYYTARYHADDLFWLSHIIYAESHWEPLAGQIGVGNVVLNRVADDRFPATVMGVVLDQEHQLQFTPVGTGEVSAEPDEQAMLATYLVLEGYNTVGASLYFVNPSRGDATWFEESQSAVTVIGNHHFYS